MDKVLYCVFDTGVLYQKVYYVEGDQVVIYDMAEQADLIDKLIAGYSNINAKKLILVGPTSFCAGMRDQIQQRWTGTLNYSKTNKPMNIEIREGEL